MAMATLMIRYWSVLDFIKGKEDERKTQNLVRSLLVWVWGVNAFTCSGWQKAGGSAQVPPFPPTRQRSACVKMLAQARAVQVVPQLSSTKTAGSYFAQ